MNPHQSNHYIQTDEGVDRGRALYNKFPRAITQMVLSRKKQWFNSDTYAKFRRLCESMDKYIDGTQGKPGTFISDVNPQTINKAYEEFVSLFEKFFETDPLFSVRKQEGITVEQERVITDLINKNLEKTNFRESCFQYTIDCIVRYGTAGTYTFAVDDYNSNSLMTVRDENAYDDTTYKQVVQPGSPAVISAPIHPLNIIIDPMANFMVQPDFKGLISDICVANIMMLAENPSYIPESLKIVIDRCKDGMLDENWFNGNETSKRDYTKGHASNTYMWLRLPFEGNEADQNWYYVEEIAGEIIRIERNNLDGNVIPLAIQRVRPRLFSMFGNSVLQQKIPIQNLQHFLINANIELTAKGLDRIILYKKGEVNLTALNARHTTNGMVPYEGQTSDLSSLMFSPQFPNNAYRESNDLWNLSRREDQDSSAMPNFNPQSDGGPTNKTLGGAQMMASAGEMRASSHIVKLCNGLKDVPRHQLAIMINILPDNDQVKQFISSNMSFSVKTSNVFNYIREGIDAQNRLTQMIQYMATGRQEFGAVKLPQYIRDYIRNTVKRENIEDYYDEQMIEQQDAMQQPGMVQQQAIPGQQQMPPQGAIQEGVV